MNIYFELFCCSTHLHYINMVFFFWLFVVFVFLPYESSEHSVPTIVSKWKDEQGVRKTWWTISNLNRFFLLHQAVICSSILHVSVLSIFVRPHWRDGSDPHFSLYFPCISPAAVYKTGFPHQPCSLGEQLSSASNENKCGVYNLNGRQLFCSHLHIMATSDCQAQWTHLWFVTY